MNAAAYHLTPRRGLDGLTSVPQQPPEPGPEQVVIRVSAASLNRRDLVLMDGDYPLDPTPGIIPLSDGVGEVIAIGDNVTRAVIGDRVTATYFITWIDGPLRMSMAGRQYGVNHNGMLATFAVLEEDSVVHVPVHLTDIEAATLACAGTTAWAALNTPVPLSDTDMVLVVGTGSVALFALQFAHVLGARTIAVTSSSEKAERLRKLAVDEVIDRTATPDWEHLVRALTDGDGVTHVVDTVGMPTLAKSIRAAALNAQITVPGTFPGPPGGLGPEPFGGNFVSIRRIAVGSRTTMEEMVHSITEHRLHPVIDRVFPFVEAPDAYRYYRTGNPFGKVVVTIGEGHS
ncbi:MAG: alcohol dehydrogenase [Nocardia sp.]|uniref:zinc-dependent alcohol dehydrogenase family protein n=1 Tax=Nocardia sp. TaxID=1821 RepID=UPI0026166228|nr:NAD(P)-dependent alcohol dehydrogenase [Nocardia sp.]MCU1647322.1 alcohol dehydrogenase [Nocardia sp.]